MSLSTTIPSYIYVILCIYTLLCVFIIHYAYPLIIFLIHNTYLHIYIHIIQYAHPHDLIHYTLSSYIYIYIYLIHYTLSTIPTLIYILPIAYTHMIYLIPIHSFIYVPCPPSIFLYYIINYT